MGRRISEPVGQLEAFRVCSYNLKLFVCGRPTREGLRDATVLSPHPGSWCCTYQVPFKGWWPTTATSCPAVRAVGLSIAPAFKHIVFQHLAPTEPYQPEQRKPVQLSLFLSDKERPFLKLLQVLKYCHTNCFPIEYFLIDGSSSAELLESEFVPFFPPSFS